jgi:hypothetical protein
MFTWNKAWFHSGESLWSIANKIAFANSTTVQQVLEYLGNVFVRHRERLMFPAVELILRMAGMLGLDSRLVALSMFAAVGERQPLNIREVWRIGIRFCPVCLDGFNHLTEFQDSRKAFCPEHGARLQDVCPHCGRRFDPLCQLPWSCNFCGFSLVKPGSRWFLDFEGGPTHQRQAEVALPTDIPLTSRHGSTPSRIRLCDIVYEELAGCAHSLAADHLDCMRVESALEFAVYRPVNFQCPMAAATIVLAKRLGIFAEGATGGWPNSRPVISESTALRQLEYLLSRVPVEWQDSLIREAVRAWYLEALSCFLEAARAGEAAVLWEPSMNEDLAQTRAETRRPWAGETLSKLEHLAASAATFCTAKTLKPSVL